MKKYLAVIACFAALLFVPRSWDNIPNPPWIGKATLAVGAACLLGIIAVAIHITIKGLRAKPDPTD